MRFCKLISGINTSQASVKRVGMQYTRWRSRLTMELRCVPYKNVYYFFLYKYRILSSDPVILFDLIIKNANKLINLQFLGSLRYLTSIFFIFRVIFSSFSLRRIYKWCLLIGHIIDVSHDVFLPANIFPIILPWNINWRKEYYMFKETNTILILKKVFLFLLSKKLFFETSKIIIKLNVSHYLQLSKRKTFNQYYWLLESSIIP